MSIDPSRLAAALRARGVDVTAETVADAVSAVCARRPSDRARWLAAEICVEADHSLGDRTPDWISQLAEDGRTRFGR